ncbi:MAG: hypothetical protein ACTSVV_06920 [Promethearchaeota archaeon]
MEHQIFKNKLILQKIKEDFDRIKYQEVINFPLNKINIILIRENPIKIRAIIIDNEREFHLIIDEKKGEIFHDCPTFLIYVNKQEKICTHLLALLLYLDENLALKIYNNLNDYKFTSEDFNSIKKSKNFLILANNCFQTNNCIEGLDYLNKAIISRCNCENVIQKYLTIAIDNNLFIEFFNFLKFCFNNELDDYLLKYKSLINRGLKKFFNSIKDYPFFDLLVIIKNISSIYQKILTILELNFIERLENLFYSDNFNENYFSAILIMSYPKEELQLAFNNYDEKYYAMKLNLIKKKALEFFFNEIENFCVIEKLALMKEQFKVLGIEKEKYINEYKRYKRYIKELEKKSYLKKFAFLKFLIHKYKITPSKGNFTKKRNTYIVNHNEKNKKNPVYKYILEHLGFYDLDNSKIKSNDLGINYFIIKKLFTDDLTILTDILYYRNQFWGNIEDLNIDSMEGITLIRENINYNYDIDMHYSNKKDLIIIEWDLAIKPHQGSIVNAYSSQITIPDYNCPLFYDLKPFDLTFCLRTPVKIEGNLIKTMHVITKCSFYDAINGVAKGIPFLEGYYPLSLVEVVLNKKIDPFEAYNLVINNPNKVFIPYYFEFIKAFKKFLFEYINTNKEYLFQKLKATPKDKINQLIMLLDIENLLAGLNLPFQEIIDNLLFKDLKLKDFKEVFINKIHEYVQNIIKERKIGSTIVFDLKKMKNTPFSKYIKDIVQIRKEEFEATPIFKKGELFDINELLKTYYGQKFSEILSIKNISQIKINKMRKIIDFSKKLGLKLNIHEID